LNIRIEADAAVNATVVQQAPSFVGVQAFREDLARPVWALWKTRQIKEAISRRNEFQLNDSAEYFFARVPKMAKPDYQPDDDDILRSRVKTMGVVEHQVKVRDRLFKITDVGGQRSERKK
jgi:guanine nucleotide-binding protein G(i) subunit alpha